LDVLGEQMGTPPSTLAMWRELGGLSALGLAVDEARRIGIRAIDAAVDMSISDVEASGAVFASLAGLAQSSRQLKITAFAAGRGPSPPGSIRLETAPADEREIISVAFRRARRIADGADDTIDDLYSGMDCGGLDPETIFPFHPTALPVLLAL